MHVTDVAVDTGLRALVIDADTDARRRLVDLLRLLNCQVQTTDQAAQACSTFARTRPHLVLIDLQLPDLDAFHVARDLRRFGGKQTARIIALSMAATTEALQRCLHPCSPFDLYLEKPLRRALLRGLCTRSRAG
jgi:CheY-like chemotaxis protein